MKKADLIALAEANEVELESGWSVGDIKAALELAEVEIPTKSKGDSPLDIYLDYDFWDDDGERVIKGTVIPMPKKMALEFIQSGKGRRAEDMA
jgi:hypothetical protein